MSHGCKTYERGRGGILTEGCYSNRTGGSVLRVGRTRESKYNQSDSRDRVGKQESTLSLQYRANLSEKDCVLAIRESSEA